MSYKMGSFINVVTYSHYNAVLIQHRPIMSYEKCITACVRVIQVLVL